MVCYFVHRVRVELRSRYLPTPLVAHFVPSTRSTSPHSTSTRSPEDRNYYHSVFLLPSVLPVEVKSYLLRREITRKANKARFVLLVRQGSI
ncbi:Protein of unknown function [Pyronema omphalodes CBS 100304]|uniref:Uncharacterized protein n=1 Tax=Pyronema omphalodes (strain CBS 100304) TaxID=1076935 RepID=U4KV39_PYROM|nr:Protein of unknown function [Pyronema omphalodes CBS 100304]